MRISSGTLFTSNAALLGQLQTQLQQTQQQVASGRRPADSPAAAARAIEVNQSDAANTQYAANRTVANNTLSMSEATMQGVTSLLQDVRTAVVQAGGGTFSGSDNRTIATELRGRLEELVGLANSTDGIGNYLFAGFQSKTQPFVTTPAGVGYVGDDGQRNVQVSTTRQMATSDSGADVFMRIKNGNGTFSTQAGAANTGTGIVSQGAVGNPPPTAAQSGNSYTLTFTVTPPVSPGLPDVITYTVTGTDALGAALPPASLPNPGSLPVPNTAPYVSGQTISFNGVQFDIQGAPANGDTFTVTPSANESVFDTISNLINALNSPVVGANLTNSLNHGLNNLDNALNNVLTMRSSLGSRLNEIDTLQLAGEDIGLQFKQILSDLQDTDYNKAISSLTQQQMTLQAAQQSFAKISGLSLFNYL